MIVIALGSNLPHPDLGAPLDVCVASLEALQARNIGISAVSRWYRSAPVPPSGQPEYVNAVAEIATELDPAALLRELHNVEDRFGRTRSHPNEARILDLDLICYHEEVRSGPEAPILPHPRLTDRVFVLLPMADIAPDWRHPATGAGIGDLIAALPEGQDCTPFGCSEP